MTDATLCALVGTERLRCELEVGIVYGSWVSTLISDTALQLPAVSQVRFCTVNKTLFKQ